MEAASRGTRQRAQEGRHHWLHRGGLEQHGRHNRSRGSLRALETQEEGSPRRLDLPEPSYSTRGTYGVSRYSIHRARLHRILVSPTRIPLLLDPSQQHEINETIVLRNEKFPTVPAFIYSGFWSEHCVKQVSITHCSITSIPDGFSRLSSLRALILHSNQLASLPAAISKIFSLRILDVHNNKIKSLPSELSRMKNLREFNISDNLFDDSTAVPECIMVLDKTCTIVGKPEAWNDYIRDNPLVDELATDEPSEAEIQLAMEKMKTLGLA